MLAEENKESVCFHVYLLRCSFGFSRHEIITWLMKEQLQMQRSLLVPSALTPCFSSRLLQIPLKFKVIFCSYSADFKGISVSCSRDEFTHRCLRGCVFSCLVTRKNSAAAATVRGIYSQSSVEKEKNPLRFCKLMH